ncbi:TetR/AcrR family transcriptional regulator [Pontibacillus litoralis]|nr:TetR/AcrR family transcriptional regulator [Pontibacillus litoralis]
MKILETAEQLIGEKGYYETSIAEITVKANIAQGTFYIYFSSKKAVFDELVYQLSSDFRYHIKIAMEKEDTFEAKQRAGFLAFFEWVTKHRNLYSIVQQAVVVDEKLYRAYYQKIAAGFITSIGKAMEAGECKSLNVETVAYCFMGVGQFIGMRWVVWRDQLVPNDVFEEAMEILFNGLTHKGGKKNWRISRTGYTNEQ